MTGSRPRRHGTTAPNTFVAWLTPLAVCTTNSPPPFHHHYATKTNEQAAMSLLQGEDDAVPMNVSDDESTANKLAFDID